MRISLEKLPFSDWKYGRTAALLRDLPYFPFTFRNASCSIRGRATLSCTRENYPRQRSSPRKIGPWHFETGKLGRMCGGKGRGKEKRKREEKIKRNFRGAERGHWHFVTGQVEQPGWITGVTSPACTRSQTRRQERRKGRQRCQQAEKEAGGGGGGGRGRGRRGSQRSVQGGDHGGRSPTYGSQWHLEARTLFFSFLPFLACPQPLSLPLTSVPFCSSHVQAQPLSPRREWTRADLETESRGLRVQDRRSSRGLLVVLIRG